MLWQVRCLSYFTFPKATKEGLDINLQMATEKSDRPQREDCTTFTATSSGVISSYLRLKRR
jgi:hypothetical protein